MPRDLNLNEIIDPDDFPEEIEWDENDFEPEEPDTLDIIQSNLADTIELLKTLDKKFEQKIKTDAHKSEMFDNMHKELTQYKNGLITQVINNILVDIIQLIDSNNKSIEYFENIEFSEENYFKLINLLKGTSEDLTDILYRQSVEPYTVEEGIDVKRQKIIQTITADSVRKP